MLEAIAHYHGFSKSGTITNLVKKEFWRIFPQGTDRVRPDPGARVRTGDRASAGDRDSAGDRTDQ